jgi:hypothetical protein
LLLPNTILCYYKGMPRKPTGNKNGRPRATDELVDLLMLRAHYEAGMDYKQIGTMFSISKSAAHSACQKAAQQYPEFIEFLSDIGNEANQFLAKEELTAALIQTETIRENDALQERLVQIKKDLADTIEETVGHLLDMSPEELRAMKTEHKLRHIPELVKTMRLLREQSTENVQKLSLVKAVGIATARQKPSPE